MDPNFANWCTLSSDVERGGQFCDGLGLGLLCEVDACRFSLLDPMHLHFGSHHPDLSHAHSFGGHGHGHAAHAYPTPRRPLLALRGRRRRLVAVAAFGRVCRPAGCCTVPCREEARGSISNHNRKSPPGYFTSAEKTPSGDSRVHVCSRSGSTRWSPGRPGSQRRGATVPCRAVPYRCTRRSA